jgi:hypothetical protein
MWATRLLSAFGLLMVAAFTAALEFLALLYQPTYLWIAVAVLTLAFYLVVYVYKRPLLSPFL